MLSDEDIFEILIDWNFWFSDVYAGIPRDSYISLISKSLFPRRIVSVTGVRRAGKSFILRQFARKKVLDLGAKNVLLVNFEDVRFSKLDETVLNRIYEVYIRRIKPGSKPLVILDEIQEVPRWEKWVRTMSELDKAMIIISGSSSKLMSPELATKLTGRHTSIYVTPLSFVEFIRFKGKHPLKQSEFIGLFEEYLSYGGFPEVVLSQDKKRILINYFEDIISKDILMRFQVNRPRTLKELAKFYMTVISKQITYRALKGVFNTSVDTIEKYTSFLEIANLIFLIERYSERIREQIKAPRKVYTIDVGLANIVGFRLTRNIGQSFENLIAIDLIRMRAIEPRLEIYYWQTYEGKEVDFLLKMGESIIALIEASYEVDITSKRKKIQSLVSAGKKFGCNNLILVTKDEEDTIELRGKKVRILPYWKFAIEWIKKMIIKIEKL